VGFTAAGAGAWIAGNAATITAVAGAAGAAVGVAGQLGAFGGPKLTPPSPVLSQSGVDQGQQAAEQNALRRQSIAGGIDSSVGTAGGQAGQMLNPANMGAKSMLGQ